MTLLGDFLRVSRARRCPICDRPDWCLVSRDNPSDPSLVICARVESPRRWRDAGWLHRLRADDQATQATPRTRIIRATPEAPTRDALAELNARYEAAVNLDELKDLALDLGVSVTSLQRLGIGWCGWGWSFPMRKAAGRLCGIRVRKRDGAKLAIGGSREGLFIPPGLEMASPLLVCEGPTDTAAMLDLDLPAIGRPSCQGGRSLVVEYVRRHDVLDVVITADRDKHDAGQRGAKSLASSLAIYVPRVRIVVPPVGVKDAREWVRRGVTRDDVLRVVSDAPTQQLAVRVVASGGKLSHGR